MQTLHNLQVIVNKSLLHAMQRKEKFERFEVIGGERPKIGNWKKFNWKTFSADAYPIFLTVKRYSVRNLQVDRISVKNSHRTPFQGYK